VSLFFSDIFGLESGRTKQIADELGLAGFVAVLPDVFGKDAWTPTSDWSKFGEWAKKADWDVIQGIINKLLAYLEGLGVKSFGILGFCWGSWPVVKASGSGKFSAGVSLHPSHPRILPMFGEDEKTVIGKIQCPQLFLPAGNDGDTVKSKGLSDQVLSTKDFGKDCVFQEFPDMNHGWSNRGDVSDPKVARDVRGAMDLVTAFLKKHVSKL